MNLSEILTDKLISMQIINAEEKEIYSYGFKQGLLLLVNMITIIIIGFFFNMIWYSLIFMIAYSNLRVYAGGYHAGTPFRCYLFSVVMISAILWLIKSISWNGTILFIIATVSCIVILLMAPVEDANKPLDQEEKRIFKKRTNIKLSFTIGFALFFWFIGAKQVSIGIVMGIFAIFIMLIFGEIKNAIW